MNHEGRGVEDRKGLEGHAGDADGERQIFLSKIAPAQAVG